MDHDSAELFPIYPTGVFPERITHCLLIILNLLVTVVWIKENAVAQQVAAKVFMDTFDGLDAPVLKYHAHIFDITWRKEINPTRNKKSTCKMQIALNSRMAPTHVRISPVMNSIATMTSSWKMEVLNTVKKNPPTAEKVTAPI